MAVTMEQVRKALDPEEPDYAKAAKLGPEALPHLAKLIAGKDPGLASKAASLAGMIGGEKAAPVLEKAAASKDVRVPLVADDDVGVQKVALRSVPRKVTPELKAGLETAAKRRAVPELQELSKKVLGRVSVG
jgi:HEAT repeat protein